MINLTSPSFYFERNPEWWDVSPCIMKNKDGTCKGLTIECPGELDCKFYKDKEANKKSLKKWDGRMRVLPYEKQLYYSKKYYGGKFIWKNI